MRRQGQYMDSGMNPMMQQQNPYPPHQLSGNAYSTPDPVRPSDAHYSGASRSAEGQWQQDRDSGQGKPGSHSYMYDAQRRDTKHGGMEKGSTDSRAANQNNSVPEGEYNDRISVLQTVDALEQGFLQDLAKLLKEHHDAEDAEFSRHRERLNEINAHYQDKLAALRMEQGKIRDDFLRKESQSRFQQYQQQHLQNPNSSMALYPNNPPPSLPSLPGGVHHSYPSSTNYNMEGGAQRTTGNLHTASPYSAEGYRGGYSGDSAVRTDFYPPPQAQGGQYKSGDHTHGRGLEPRYTGGGRGYNAGSRQH